MIYIVLFYVLPALIGWSMVVASVANKRCSNFFEIWSYGDALSVACMFLIPFANIALICCFIHEKLKRVGFWKRRFHR